MIELGRIEIQNEAALVESRGKILGLARDLQFGPIDATRLATVTSELVRAMARTGRPSSITVELGLKRGVFGLLLTFVSKRAGEKPDRRALEAIFDAVDVSPAEEGLESVEAFKALPEPDLDISEAFIAREKERIALLTREELYDQLDAAYSDLKSKTTQLIQTEKLGSVGTMVAGVAHELNNPMMGLINFIQYCLKHTTEDDRRYAVLKDAEHEARRCIAIVENLLTFSRMEKEGEEGLSEADCSELMERVIKLLSYRIEKEGAALTTHYAAGTPKIRVKVNNVQQVFLNLVNNALDALKESERKEIRIGIGREAGSIKITIADTGIGIPGGLLEKIFDPFFTTKPTGGGTGLGLSICQGIVKIHGGEIACESKIGRGTTFTILLPLTSNMPGSSV